MSLSETRNPSSLSRRQFLRRAAITAAAAAPVLSIARGAHAAGNEVIRIGMVGCGGRCSGAAVDAMTADPAVRLVAMADLFVDRVRGKRNALKRQCPDQRPGRRRPLLRRARRLQEGDRKRRRHRAHRLRGEVPPDVRQARRSTPASTSSCEKPHGIDPRGIKVLTAACNKAKQNKQGVLSGLQSRFHAAIAETMQRVHDGQIGEIVSIEENFLRGPYGCTAHPKVNREIEAQYGNQYRFSWLCGDDVTQSLVHNLDRATWALKETPPVNCHGLGGRSGPQNLLGDVFDHHSVVYKYASGVRVYALMPHNRRLLWRWFEHHHGRQGHRLPVLGRHHRRRSRGDTLERTKARTSRNTASSSSRSARASRSIAATTWRGARWCASWARCPATAAKRSLGSRRTSRITSSRRSRRTAPGKWSRRRGRTPRACIRSAPCPALRKTFDAVQNREEFPHGPLRRRHAEVLHEKRPVVGGFLDPLRDGFSRAVAGGVEMRISTGALPACARCIAAANLKLWPGTTRSSVSAVAINVAG